MSKIIPKSWYANLQSLRAVDVTDEDIIIVRLLMIEKDNEISIKEKICPARIKEKNDVIEWYISDYIGSELMIEVPIDSKRLGHTVIETEDSAEIIYIIAGYRVLQNDNDENAYRYTINVKSEDALTVYVHTAREADNIVKAMKAAGIKAEIEKNFPK